MLLSAPAQTFDGGNSSFAANQQNVRIWVRAADVDSALIPYADTIRLLARLHSGGSAQMQNEAAESILNISREYFAPDALGLVY